MARTRVRQTTTRTTRTRVRRNTSGSGYRICNMCHGTGRVKKR